MAHWNFKRFLSPRKIVVISIFIGFSLITGCPFYAAGIRSGVVIDKEAGNRIHDVILVRSWDKITALIEVTHHDLARSETTTNRKGKFFFFPKIFLSFNIPLISGVEENKLIAFKPGYSFVVVDENTTTIEMTRIPASYYLRYEELYKLKGNYEVDINDTKLLKATVSAEEETLPSLHRYIQGVFYQGFTSEANYLLTPHDIAVDEKNNVYIGDSNNIKKISGTGQLINKARVSITGHSIYIDIDAEGNLYAQNGSSMLALDSRTLLGKRLFSIGDKAYLSRPEVSFTAVSGQFFYMQHNYGYAFPPTIVSYNLAGDFICEYHITKNFISEHGYYKGLISSPKETHIELADITSNSEGYVYSIYSYVNSERKYRNGIVKLDNNCNELLSKRITLDVDKIGLNARAKGIDVLPDNNLVITDKDSIYFFDENLELIFREDLSGHELGEVSIDKIASDPLGDSLYLIEDAYRRILKYDIKRRELST